MKTYLEVENFGKIQKAKVAYNGYTVFVGDNNSGKSYLMQLIYAVEKEASANKNEYPTFEEVIKEKMSESDTFFVDTDDLKLMVNDVNLYFDSIKDKLTYNTFRKSVRIDALRLDLELDEEFQLMVTIQKTNKLNMDESENRAEENHINEVKIRIRAKNAHLSHVIYGNDLDESSIANSIVRIIFGQNGTLYFPASRAGIQLLYKDFFASRTDDIFYADGENQNGIQLTTPMYEYLKFLQLMSKSKTLSDTYEQLINFIDNNIIDGHIDLSENNEVTYSQHNGVQNVPLYLTSSMITEVAPIVEALLDGRYHGQFLIDEVEACLNPKKQREMSRLLVRIRNLGSSLIVSTHSDSMAAYINNLLLASIKRLNDEQLSEINYTEDDLLRDADVRFYEFRCNEDGFSVVEELELHGYPNDGIEFNIFNENIDRLYSETKKIIEVRNETASF